MIDIQNMIIHNFKTINPLKSFNFLHESFQSCNVFNEENFSYFVYRIDGPEDVAKNVEESHLVQVISTMIETIVIMLQIIAVNIVVPLHHLNRQDIEPRR